MTAEQLKNSILQMAVQGKLVPQDPSDEPASVLLERIKTEKQELIKAGKIKKDTKSSEIFRGASRNSAYTYCEQIGKEIRDISDEIPFDIPDSWEWCRLKNISVLITKGTTPRGGNVAYLNQGIGFLRAENVAGMDKLDTSKMNYIDNETHNNFLKRSILCENDLLITIAGTLGRTAIVRKEDLPLNANQAVSIVRLVNSFEYDLMYLIIALNAPKIQKLLTEQKKITAIPNLTLEIISDCFIPLPPLAEQKRIVSKIEELLPYIEQYEKSETQLSALNETFPEMLKKSILQEAVQGKLVPQDPSDEPAGVLLERIKAEKQRLIKDGKIKKDKHESVIFTRDKIPYTIPESWEWCKVGDLCSNMSGLSYKKEHLIQKTEKMVRVLRGGNILDGKYLLKDDDVFISEQFVKSELYLKRNYMITPSVTSMEHIGKIALIDKDYQDVVVGGFVLMLIPYLNDDTLVKYLLYAFSTKYHRDCCRNITHKSGQAFYNLSREKLMEIYVPIPPLDEQKRIVAKIEELMDIINKIR